MSVKDKDVCLDLPGSLTHTSATLGPDGQPLACKEKENMVVLRIRVKDSGIGIPKDKHHLIFNAFSQVDSSGMLCCSSPRCVKQPFVFVW